MTWKFQGQGLNPCHSSDLSHSSDNVGSLTHWATRELPTFLLDISLWRYHLWLLTQYVKKGDCDLTYPLNRICSYLFFLFFFFSRLHPWHMEVPRLGVKSELQPLAYTTTTATWDLNHHVWDLHHSSRQCWIRNPLSKAGYRNLMDPSQVC